jgi:hypothetical protein
MQDNFNKPKRIDMMIYPILIYTITSLSLRIIAESFVFMLQMAINWGAVNLNWGK